jgi:hypothetical protein
MTSKQESNSTRELNRWLASLAYDTLATITLKQAILNDEGGLTPLTRDECKSTLWIFRDRLAKAVLGNRRYRHGARLKFAPFIEGGDGTLRHHFHVALVKPADVDRSTFHQKIRSVAGRLHWTRDITDVREIVLDQGSSGRVVGYCLKEGSDAFCPEGASL